MLHLFLFQSPFFYTGCAVLVGTETEKVIDLSVKTRTCTPSKKKLQFDVCYPYYSGTSGGMEATGKVEMFKRSEQDEL